jgi:hypothetical protein
VPAAGRVRETQMRREEATERGDLLGPLDWGRSLPYVPAAASDRLGWVGLEAARYRALPAAEHIQPALTHHQLVLFVQPPDAFALRGEGVTRHVPIHIKLSTPRKLLWHYRVATHTIMPASKELPYDDHTTGSPCHA